jgi:hypothetical protein
MARRSMATAQLDEAMWRHRRMRMQSAAETMGEIAKLTQYCAGVDSKMR